MPPNFLKRSAILSRMACCSLPFGSRKRYQRARSSREAFSIWSIVGNSSWLLIIGSKESLSEHSGYAQHPTFYASNIGKGYTGGSVLKKIWNDPVWSKV